MVGGEGGAGVAGAAASSTRLYFFNDYLTSIYKFMTIYSLFKFYLQLLIAIYLLFTMY